MLGPAVLPALPGRGGLCVSAGDYLKALPGQTAEQIGPATGNTGSRRPSTWRTRKHTRAARRRHPGTEIRPARRPGRAARSVPRPRLSARVSERPAAQAAEQPFPGFEAPGGPLPPRAPRTHALRRRRARPKPAAEDRARRRRRSRVRAARVRDIHPVQHLLRSPPEEEHAAEAEPESPPTPEERLAALPAVQVELAELDLPTGTEPQAFAPAPGGGRYRVRAARAVRCVEGGDRPGIRPLRGKRPLLRVRAR